MMLMDNIVIGFTIFGHASIIIYIIYRIIKGKPK